MKPKPMFMSFSRGDVTNFVMLMVIGLAVIPVLIQTDYWYSSILIPWLCLSLAAIGQQIVMG